MIGSGAREPNSSLKDQEVSLAIDESRPTKRLVLTSNDASSPDLPHFAGGRTPTIEIRSGSRQYMSMLQPALQDKIRNNLCWAAEPPRYVGLTHDGWKGNALVVN
jgi:hypothetical protein